MPDLPESPPFAKQPKRSSPLQIMLTEPERALLDSEAARRGVTLADLIREALHAHLGPFTPAPRTTFEPAA